MKKVAIIVQTAAPYRDRIIETYINNTNDKIFTDIYLINTQEKSMHPEWEYTSPLNFKNLREKEPIKTFYGTLDFEIIKKLIRGGYDSILISGWFPATSLIIELYCIIFNKRFSVMLDSVEINKKTRTLAHLILNKAYSIFVPGNMSKNFLISEGVPENKIYKGIYTNDNEKIYNIIESKKIERNHIRDQYGLKENDFCFLFVGKLIPTRRIGNLLKAIDRQTEVSKYLIVGDGPDLELVNDFAIDHSNVIHLSSVPLENLHELYAIADAYIHPGKEPFSLALVEAAIAGLPIVSTDEVGAAYDVIKQNQNGIIVPFDSVSELTIAIERVRKGEMNINAIEKEQKILTNQYNIKWAAEQLEKVLDVE